MFSLDGYRTIRTTAAAVPREDRGILTVTGADRASWLQGLLSNDVERLPEGERRYAAYLTPQGRMITDMYVVALADRLLLEVPAPLASALRERLDGLIFSEDAQVTDDSASLAVWGVYGPDATGGLADPSFGVPGAVFYLDRSQPLPPAIAALPQVDLDTLDVLRIEAGTPAFLVDMDTDTIPLEAGIEGRAILVHQGLLRGPGGHRPRDHPRRRPRGEETCSADD